VIICNCWPSHNNTVVNFGKYREILPAVYDMLSHDAISPEVSALIIGLVKRLIIDNLDAQKNGGLSRETLKKLRASQNDQDD